MCLIHINRSVQTTSKRRNEHLIDIELHNEVRQPPALYTLYTIPITLTLRQPLLGDTAWAHTRSRLSPQTTRALLCLNDWSRLGLVHKADLKAAAALDEVKGDVFDYEMENTDWDSIKELKDDE